MKNFHKKRISARIRDKYAETSLSTVDFVQPYFIVEGEGVKEEIPSMPGVCRFSVDRLLKDINKLEGINKVLFFGVTDRKSDTAEEAYNSDGIVQKAVMKVKERFKSITVITDVCLCGYTSHGHCGILKKKREASKGEALMDLAATLKTLAKTALSHAESGADMVAPSAMMGGQVAAIKESLSLNGFDKTGILAYSAKYASNFYGPFRDAVSSVPRFGDRKTYQMDYRNFEEAMDEIEEDIKEGADIVMVKPALSYLDIISKAKERFDVPVAAYSVSGEYSMIKKTAEGDRQTEKELALEILTSIKRAGADIIITYWGKEAVKWIK